MPRRRGKDSGKRTVAEGGKSRPANRRQLEDQRERGVDEERHAADIERRPGRQAKIEPTAPDRSR
jgi:hypothetical protein